jgi:hypothetical protein
VNEAPYLLSPTLFFSPPYSSHTTKSSTSHNHDPVVEPRRTPPRRRPTCQQVIWPSLLRRWVPRSATRGASIGILLVPTASPGGAVRAGLSRCQSSQCLRCSNVVMWLRVLVFSALGGGRRSTNDITSNFKKLTLVLLRLSIITPLKKSIYSTARSADIRWRREVDYGRTLDVLYGIWLYKGVVVCW